MQRPPILLGTLALTLASAFAGASAQEPPVIRRGAPEKDPGISALSWLDRMDALKRLPVDLDQFMEGSVIGARVEGSGHFLYADQSHFRSTMSLSLQFEGQPQPRVQSMLMVGDGTTVWTEMRDTYLKIPMVNKLPVRLMSQVGQAAGAGFGGGEVHPIAQIRSLTDLVVLDTVEEKEKVVLLKGAFSEAAKWKLGEQFFGLEVKTLTLALDAETAFPRSMRVDGAEGLYLEFRYTRVKHPQPEEVDMQQFLYEPPENAQVQDLEEAMKQGRTGGQTGG